jgi:23S rRNA (cytosine1962-C5)-methyltransferase
MTLSAPLRMRFLSLLADDARRSEGDSIRRICWGSAQGLPGLLVDGFGDLIVGTHYDPSSSLCAEEWASLFAEAHPAGPWILKLRQGGESAGSYLIRVSEGLSTGDVFVAQEDGIRFEIHTDVRHDFGVFPDAAAARRMVRSEARGARVLNLFSYTCGFGLAAAAGGAASVCNVDANRDYLTWGKRNALLNGLDFRVIPETAQAYLRRLVRRLEAGRESEFDFVVADPPAFGVGRDNDRLLRLFWPEMASHLVRLAPEKMVLLFNDKYFRAQEDVEVFVRKAFGEAYSARWENPAASDPFYLPPHVVFLSRRDPDPRA